MVWRKLDLLRPYSDFPKFKPSTLSEALDFLFVFVYYPGKSFACHPFSLSQREALDFVPVLKLASRLVPKRHGRAK